MGNATSMSGVMSIDFNMGEDRCPRSIFDSGFLGVVEGARMILSKLIESTRLLKFDEFETTAGLIDRLLMKLSGLIDRLTVEEELTLEEEEVENDEDDEDDDDDVEKDDEEGGTFTKLTILSSKKHIKFLVSG
jgi:hypothetical protein